MTLTVKELIEHLTHYPEWMKIGLWDMSTDDFENSNYELTKDMFLVEEYTDEEGGEIKGKMLFITFENKLNENPI